MNWAQVVSSDSGRVTDEASVPGALVTILERRADIAAKEFRLRERINVATHRCSRPKAEDRVLELLKETAPVPLEPAAIAERLALGRGTCSKAASRLEKKGLAYVDKTARHWRYGAVDEL